MAFNVGDLIARVGADISGFKSAMTDVSSTAGKTAGSVEGSAGKIATALSALAPKLTAAGILTFILNTGREFERASAQIAKETGQIGANLESLEGSFKALYEHSGRSAEEIAGGIAKVATETKLMGQELEDLTAANLKFAKVARTDVVSAVDQTQVLFQNWGVATQNQSEALDVLYTAMTSAGMTVTELTSQMTELGPVARSFGLSFIDTAALVATFDDAGLKAADMVRGLNSLFVKFAEAGKDPKQAFLDLIEKLKDTKTQTAAVNQLIEAGFAKRSAVAMADAAKRGALAFDGLAKRMEESKGKVEEVAEATKTLSDRWAELQHQLAVAAEPSGNFIIKWVNDSLDHINKLNVAMGFLFKYATGQVKPNPVAPSIPAAGGSALKAPPAGAGASGSPGASGSAAAGSFFIYQAASAEQAASAVDHAKETVQKYMDALGGLKEYGAEIWSDLSSQVLDFSVLAEAAGPVIAEMVELPAKSFDEALNPAIRESEAAMHALGIVSTRELRAQYDDAMRAAEAMVANGASVNDVAAAMARVAELHKTVAQRTGEWDGQINKTTKSAGVFARQVSTVFTDLSRSLADVVMGTKNLGDAFKDVGKAIVRIILEDVISNAFGSLVKFLKGTVLPHLGAVGSAIAGVLGGGGGGAVKTGSTIIDETGQAVNIGGGAAKAATGAASGLTGMLGAIGSIGSMVSGIVSNIQMLGIGHDTGKIEVNTRGILAEVGNLRVDSWMREEHLMHKLDDIWSSIRDIGKGAGATFDFRGSTFGAGLTQSAVNQMFEIAYKQALAKVGA